MMKTGFSLWKLAHREFPVSYTGFGFAVSLIIYSKAICGEIQKAHCKFFDSKILTFLNDYTFTVNFTKLMI